MKRRRKQEPKELLLSGLIDSTPWTSFSLQPSTPFPKLLNQTKEPNDDERHRLTSIYTATAQCLMCGKYELVSKFPLWMKNMDDKHIWFQFNFVFFRQILLSTVWTSVEVLIWVLNVKPNTEDTHAHTNYRDRHAICK